MPAIEPGERGKASFDLPEGFFDCDVLEVTAIDPFGHEICTWSAPIKRASRYWVEQGKATTGKAQWSEAGEVALLKAQGVEAAFNAKTGLLTKVMSNGKEIAFNNGPRPVGMKAEVIGSKMGPMLFLW